MGSNFLAADVFLADTKKKPQLTSVHRFDPVKRLGR